MSISSVFANLLRFTSFAIVMWALALSQTLRAQTDGRHALTWEGANLALPPNEISYLVDKVVNTDVQWAVLTVLWTESELGAPTPTPQGVHTYFGPRVQLWHNYDFTALDQVVAELQSNGINVSIKLFYHPLWAGGGQPCTETSDSCGKILVGYRQIFKDNYYDFAYNIVISLT